MAISGGAVLLALAGVATAAALIFTASLAVLWPVLIGCACVAVVGAIIFMVVRCVGAKNGGKRREDEGQSSADPKNAMPFPVHRPKSSANEDYTEINKQRDQANESETSLQKEEREPKSESRPTDFLVIGSLLANSTDDVYLEVAPANLGGESNISQLASGGKVVASAPDHIRSTQNTIIDFVHILENLGDNVTIDAALQELRKSTNIPLSEGNGKTICDLIGDIWLVRDGKRAETLGDLRREASRSIFDHNSWDLPDSALPFLIPILALSPDSEFALGRDSDGTFGVEFAFHCTIPIHKYCSQYAIFNHIGQRQNVPYEEWRRIYFIKGILAVHYEEDRRLVVDYSMQAAGAP
jgi:hypothetical protein